MGVARRQPLRWTPEAAWRGGCSTQTWCGRTVLRVDGASWTHIALGCRSGSDDKADLGGGADSRSWLFVLLKGRWGNVPLFRAAGSPCVVTIHVLACSGGVVGGGAAHRLACAHMSVWVEGRRGIGFWQGVMQSLLRAVSAGRPMHVSEEDAGAWMGRWWSLEGALPENSC